jgi:hypothetical protein
LPSTQLFDPVIYDSAVFDTSVHNTVEIVEYLTRFDSAVFDPNVFDTVRGGEIVITDLLARQQGTKRTLSESTSISDSLARVVSFFRTLTEPSITISDSLARTKSAIRAFSESISISDVLARITPTVNRYIYDLGSVFDTFYFDPAVFDTNVKSYTITDSVARSDRFKPSITETAVSISDAVNRIKGAARTIADSVSISDSVARIKGAVRAIADSVSVSDSVGIVQSIFRTITQTVTVSDVAARTIVRYITLSESVSISDALAILSGRARGAIAYLTKRVSSGEITIRANNSDITKRTASIRTDEY